MKAENKNLLKIEGTEQEFFIILFSADPSWIFDGGKMNKLNIFLKSCYQWRHLVNEIEILFLEF